MKKYLFAVTALIILTVIYIFPTSPAPKDPISNDHAETRLEDIIAKSWANTRFDIVTVEVDNGFLDIALEDTSICATMDAVFRIERHINLHDFQTVKRRGVGAVDLDSVRFMPRNDGQSLAAIQVPILLTRDADARTSITAQRKEQIIAAARKELGWGPAAGSRAYEIFTETTPDLQNLSFSTRVSCDGGVGIDLVKSRFTLHIAQEDAEEYITVIDHVITELKQ